MDSVIRDLFYGELDFSSDGFIQDPYYQEAMEKSHTLEAALLESLTRDLYQRALENREKRTWAATTMDEVKKLAAENTGYIKTMWCGDLACELKMKEEAGLSSRCMPFEQEHLSDVCPCCGKPAKTMVYWGIAY